MYDDSSREREYLLRLTGSEYLPDFHCVECMKNAQNQLLIERYNRALKISKIHKTWLADFLDSRPSSDCCN